MAWQGPESGGVQPGPTAGESRKEAKTREEKNLTGPMMVACQWNCEKQKVLVSASHQYWLFRTAVIGSRADMQPRESRWALIGKVAGGARRGKCPYQILADGTSRAGRGWVTVAKVNVS